MSLLERLQKEKVQEDEIAPQKSKKNQPQEDPFKDIKKKIHAKIVSEIKELDVDDECEKGNLEQNITNFVETVLDEESTYLSKSDKQKIISEILDETIGFGPINKLINDPTISEIMVNGAEQVYVEKHGKLVLSDVRFRDDQHIMHVIEKIVAPIGRRIDESSPMVDARLPNGSRVNAIIPPLSLNGPTLTIRKFSENPLTVNDLIKFGTLTPNIAIFIKACVEARLNIVVSG